MPHGYDSLADYYRAHREAMNLSLATGCTPKEAEIELRRRAKARRAACGTHAPDPAHTDNPKPSPDEPPHSDFRDWDASWMQRD
ncbi:MAG: hypothetical protein KUG65_05950 [Sphingomonadaceae bacterium]|nr:hypothetical protein [Sphingomonadaceae bacterium]